jgi:CheY-like chemotaxis protein
MVQMSHALRVTTPPHLLTAIKFDMPAARVHAQMQERRCAMHVEIGEGIRSVLIVEDEMIVAMLIEDLMRELGVTDVLICPDVASALETLKTRSIDCAILDLRVRDGNSTPVADALAAKGIPFVVSSGSDAGALEDRHAGRPMIGKPFLDDDLKLIVLDTWALAHADRVAGAFDGQRIWMSSGK